MSVKIDGHSVKVEWPHFLSPEHHVPTRSVGALASPARPLITGETWLDRIRDLEERNNGLVRETNRQIDLTGQHARAALDLRQQMDRHVCAVFPIVTGAEQAVVRLTRERDELQSKYNQLRIEMARVSDTARNALGR